MPFVASVMMSLGTHSMVLLGFGAHEQCSQCTNGHLVNMTTVVVTTSLVSTHVHALPKNVPSIFLDTACTVQIILAYHFVTSAVAGGGGFFCILIKCIFVKLAICHHTFNLFFQL